MGTSSHPSHIGRYQIQRLIGAGGMGDVYLATDPHIERQLAIKTVRLRGAAAEVEDHKQRLLREAKATGRLVHPHVVTLFDAGEVDGLLFLAFEFVDGPDLGRRMKSRPPLSLGHSLNLVKQIAEGLDFAHVQGIIHRDIKPSNILLDPRGHAKIADFGLAKMNDESMELTRTGSVVGSPQYMSPEQVRGETLDGRTDIFSLGVLLYEMMTSLRPFGGQTISTLVFEILSKEPPPLAQLRPDLPAGIFDLVRHMMAKDPSSRIASAGDIVQHLDAVLTQTPSSLLDAPAYTPLDANAPTELLAQTPTPGSVAPRHASMASTPEASSASLAVTTESGRSGPPPPPPVPTLPMSSPGFAGPPPPPNAATAPPAEGASSPPTAVDASSQKASRWGLWGLLAVLLLLLLGAGGWGVMQWLQRAKPSGQSTVAESIPAESALTVGEGASDPPPTTGRPSASVTDGTVPEGTASGATGVPPSPGDGRPTVTEGPSGVSSSPSASTPARQAAPQSVGSGPASSSSRERSPQTGSPPTGSPQTGSPQTGSPQTGSPRAAPQQTAVQAGPPAQPKSTAPSNSSAPVETPAAGTSATSDAGTSSRPTATAPTVEPHVAAFDAAAAGAQRELNSGRFFKFLIEPPEAVVRLWQRGEERQVVLGQARQYTAKKRDSRSVELPDDGDYLFTFIGEGHPDFMVLVHATSGRGLGPQVIRAQLGAVGQERGGPQRIRVSRSLAFEGTPSDATVYVDGVAKGPASQWPGGLRAAGPRNLQMKAGRHRLRIAAEGYEPYEAVVEVSPAGPRTATVTYELKPQP